MPININRIRKDFPILSRKIRGQVLVYLDNAATTQKPKQVIETMNKFYRSENANIHRGIYYLSEQATIKYEQAREKVANFINADSPKEIIFTRGTTESINLVAQIWGRQNINKGDAILISEMEHHSNLLPWQELAKENGAHLRFIPITDDGELDLKNLPKLLKNVKLVAITGMSNVLGTINPVKEIVKQAHKAGAKVLVDGAQFVPHLKTDVQLLNCDFIAFSGHKMCGPTGIGVLYGKYELLEQMPPYQFGGEMVKVVEKDRSIWQDVPQKFEAGTPNIAGAIGLAAAIDYLNKIGMKNIRAQEEKLVKYALEKISQLKDVKIFGPKDIKKRGGAISFSLKGIHPHDLATILDETGICIRSGHHCAMPLHMRLSQVATARASFYFYNTKEEVDKLVGGIKYAQTLFSKAYKLQATS